MEKILYNKLKIYPRTVVRDVRPARVTVPPRNELVREHSVKAETPSLQEPRTLSQVR